MSNQAGMQPYGFPLSLLEADLRSSVELLSNYLKKIEDKQFPGVHIAMTPLERELFLRQLATGFSHLSNRFRSAAEMVASDLQET